MLADDGIQDIVDAFSVVKFLRHFSFHTLAPKPNKRGKYRPAQRLLELVNHGVHGVAKSGGYSSFYKTLNRK